jgi:tetratricopeptide (TPR) repeat protein
MNVRILDSLAWLTDREWTDLLGAFMEMDSNQQLNQSIKDALAGKNAMLGFMADDDLLVNQSKITSFEIGRSFYQLGKLHYDKSDLSKAEDYFIKAYQCSEKPRDFFSIFKILGFLIRIASEKLENDKASTYITEAENVVGELTTSLGSLNAEYFYNVGSINTYKGTFEEARINYELAYKKATEENEPELLSKTLLALSVNSFNLKNFEKALDYLNQLNQLLKIIKKNYLSGAMFLFSGKVFTELAMHERALEHFTLANEVLQDKKCWNLYGYVLLGKGIVLKRSGHYERALDYFSLAKESIDKMTFRRLSELLDFEIAEVNDNSVDLYLDHTNRKIKEKMLGTIDFKHRFVLLEILFLLAKNPGEYYDKEQLARQIWKDEYNPLIHDKLIYTSVSRLRKLIEPKNERGDKRKYIIRGKDGYTFNPLAKIRFHMEGSSSSSQSIGNVELSSPV